MVFLISNTVKVRITAAVGELFFLRLRRWWITFWKLNIFIRKNYFVFITYAQIYLQNFKTFDAILCYFKFTKITFFQAVKLVVPLKLILLSFVNESMFNLFVSINRTSKNLLSKKNTIKYDCFSTKFNRSLLKIKQYA